MNFEEFRDIIANSRGGDWHKINRTGPTYRDWFGSWTSPEGSGITADSHGSVAVYRPDVDITMAFGMSESQRGGGPTFKWSKHFPDSEIDAISIVDFFYRGSLIDRVNYVNVDGGRGVLPLGTGHQGTNITRHDYAVARLLSDLEGCHTFDRYYDDVPYEYED